MTDLPSDDEVNQNTSVNMKFDSKKVSDCIQSLQAERLINLHIGDEDDAFSVQLQQSLLEASSEYFRKALRGNRFVEAKSGKFKFPMDDVESWKALIYWLVHRKLPNGNTNVSNRENFMAFSRCWLLGDKYKISDFQNDAMMRLIEYASGSEILLDPVEYRWLIACSPPKSGLMVLVAEEIAWLLKHGRLSWSDLGDLDGTAGFWPTLFNAVDLLKKNEHYLGKRLEGVETWSCDPCAHWRNYMVGDLPQMIEALADKPDFD